MNRKKFITIYFIFFIILSSSIYFGLKYFSKKNFNDQNLNQLMVGKSKFRDTTTDLCKYQALGEPKVDKEYVKINFWCNNGSKARSTFALKAFSDQTTTGVLNEYARIIGFDINLIKEKGWYCTLNDLEIDSKVALKQVELASTIDCFETKGLSKNDQENN